MAELILSPEEKAAELWSDLDDAALGAFLRKKLHLVRTSADQMDRTVAMAAALLLCCDLAEAGASESTIEIEGVTQAGRRFGDFDIHITRKRLETRH